MATPRVQVSPPSLIRESEPGLTRQRLRPASGTVDISERTAEGSQLVQLAQALGDAAPSLGRLSDTIAARNASKDKAAGAELAKAQFADLLATGQKIKAGEIAPSESAWFRYGAREQFGRLMSDRFSTDLAAFIKEGPLSTSQNPQDFDPAVYEFRNKWLEEHVDGADEAFTAGFSGGENEAIHNARASFNADADKRLQGTVLEQTYQEHRVLLRSGGSPEEIAKAIHEANKVQYALNPSSGTNLNATTIQAVIDAAKAANDPLLLRVLDHIQGGVPGSRLSDLSAFADDIVQAERQIRQERQARYSFDLRQAREVAKETVRTTLTDAVEALESAEDPMTVDLEQYKTTLTDLDEGERVEQLYRIQARYAERKEVTEDEGLVNGLYSKALRGNLTLGEALDAFDTGQISRKSLKEIRAAIGKARGNGKEHPLLSDKGLTIGRRSVSNLFGAEYGYNNALIAVRSSLAEDEFERNYIEWRSGEGATATEAQVREFVDQQKVSLFNKYTEGISGLSAIAATVNNTTFSGAENGSTAGRPAGPQLVTDWENQPVAPQADISRMAKEYGDFRAGKLSSLPPQTWTFLYQTMGLVSPEDVDRFFATQAQLLQAQ